MSTQSTEYTCKKCGHGFGRMGSQDEKGLCCPRCGGSELEHNPYLFGSPSAEGLTPEDYFDVALAPCCTPDWKGWHHHFCYVPAPKQPEKEITDEKDKSGQKPD
jgi:DNA-directed RNA polymerase subunit RPC12/RpoP